jgi:putative aminopeptidase
MCLGLSIAPALPARASSLDMLARLQGIPALPGMEDTLRAALASDLPGWSRPEVDAVGNLVVDLGGDGPVRLLAAPLDEPGYVITDFDTLGYLRVSRLGGSGRLFDQFQVGQRFRILTARGPLPAVSAAPSTHFRRTLAEPLTVADLWLDAGFHSRTEAGRAGVQMLDPITPVERFTQLAGMRAAGPGLEGRAEAAALLRALMGERPACRGHWVAAFTAQAQPGGRGLRRLMRRFQPSEVYLLAAFPRARLGLGPAVHADSLKGLAPDLAQALVRLGGRGAQRQAASFSPDRAGIDPLDRARVAVLGLPVRYARTPSEVVDAADVDALAALLRRMLEGM